MLCTGYKLSGYDATYRKTTFNVIESRKGVLEITDTNSGATFILDLESLSEESRDRTRSWRNGETKGEGTMIEYGNKGWYQKLKYGNRRRKQVDVLK